MNYATIPYTLYNQILGHIDQMAKSAQTTEDGIRKLIQALEAANKDGEHDQILEELRRIVEKAID